MLTGMLEISEGDAMVYNYSVKKNASVVQKNLGLCQ
jgi:ABC-type Na+ transport system ATPase subunit NatA